jgi:hypothetical protein
MQVAAIEVTMQQPAADLLISITPGIRVLVEAAVSRFQLTLLFLTKRGWLLILQQINERTLLRS